MTKKKETTETPCLECIVIILFFISIILLFALAFTSNGLPDIGQNNNLLPLLIMHK